MADEERAPSCPSAQPDMAEARIFGVLSGTAAAPRIAYLKQSAVVDPQVVEEVGPQAATEMFRFAARCEESQCAHFNGRNCTLARRIVEKLVPVVDTLPPCTIRPTCRWYSEQGEAACLRCPQVVTRIPEADDDLNSAARPEPPTVPR